MAQTTGDSDTAPLGIKILCALTGLAALFGVLTSFGIVATPSAGAALGFMFFGFFVATLVVVYGLWILEPWGWTWGMVLLVVDLGADLLAQSLFGIVLSGFFIVYLWSKRSLYGRA